jgi:hypothetical protein
MRKVAGNAARSVLVCKHLGLTAKQLRVAPTRLCHEKRTRGGANARSCVNNAPLCQRHASVSTPHLYYNQSRGKQKKRPRKKHKCFVMVDVEDAETCADMWRTLEEMPWSLNRDDVKNALRRTRGDANEAWLVLCLRVYRHKMQARAAAHAARVEAVRRFGRDALRLVQRWTLQVVTLPFRLSNKIWAWFCRRLSVACTRTSTIT